MDSPLGLAVGLPHPQCLASPVRRDRDRNALPFGRGCPCFVIISILELLPTPNSHPLLCPDFYGNLGF